MSAATCEGGNSGALCEAAAAAAMEAATSCTCASTTNTMTSSSSVDYRSFLDLFIVISVGLSSLVVLFRLLYRVPPAAPPTATSSTTPDGAQQQQQQPPLSARVPSRGVVGGGSMPNLGLPPASSASSAAGKRSSGGSGSSVKERLEAEIRARLPRRSTYYSMPFFADTVANKSEFIDSLIGLGDGILDGWLLVKKGVQRGKNWKKRYVVLDGNGRIKYYPNAEAARKNVNIKGSLTVHAVKPGDPMEFGANTLEVRGTLGGTYFFRTDGEMVARKWLCVLTKRAIQGRVPGRIDADPSAAVLSSSPTQHDAAGETSGHGNVNGNGNGSPAGATAAAGASEAASATVKCHKLEAFVDDMTYGKEATLRQFYVVVKFKSELHDHSSVPVGQTIPKQCDKSVINWQEKLTWQFTDHQCHECAECQAIGSSTGTFKGLPDIMVLHVYEIHLRYLTTKIGQVALSLKEVFGFTGMKEASMHCTWPVMSSNATVLGQLGLKLQYSVDTAGGGVATVPFLVTTEGERELLGEYELDPKITNCSEFFQLFYANGTLSRSQAYYKARGDTEVEIGEWSESKEYGGQVRVVRCRALTNASIGPASTMSSNTQHVPFTDLSQVNPDRLVLQMRVFLHDIPYGDCFTVEQVYVVERNAASGNLVVKATLGIPFSKGCMFKSKIISATREGVGQSTKLLFEEFNKTMHTTGSGSGADGAGGSSAAPVQPFLVSLEADRHFVGQYDLHPSVKDPTHFYELFYANGTNLKWVPFYKETGDTDHEISEWKQAPEYGSGSQIRTIKFRAQNTAPIGPASTAACSEQHVTLPKDGDPEDAFVLESKMEMYDIPYGDCFSVETVYVVGRATPDAPHLTARVFVGIPFKKSTMFKGKIVSGTRDGVTKTTAKVFEFFRTSMEAESSATGSTTDSSNTAATTRSSESGGRTSLTAAAGNGAKAPRRVMLARLNSTLDGSVALEEIFENQRVSIFGKWGPNHMLPTDRCRFTNRNGDVELSFDQIALPRHWTWTSPWKIDKSYTECDEEGWSYATDFPRFKSHLARGKSSTKRLGNSVRRRRWMRMMAYAPPEGDELNGGANSAANSASNSPTGAAATPAS